MKKTLLIIAVMAYSLTIGFADIGESDFSGIVRRMEIAEMKATSFSIDNLVTYLKMQNAPDIEVVVAQFIVETGWFKSRLFTVGNNICGMKVAKKRSTTATGTMYGYASFAHWTDSVDDFLLWLKYHNLSEGYFDHIQKKSYSENGSYCSLVLKVVKMVKKRNIC